MNKIFKFILIVITFSFIMTYIVYRTGYYEYKLNNKTLITKEQMEKFEHDIELGKNVTLNDYYIDREINYRTKLTSSTYNLSKTVNTYLKETIEIVFKNLNKFVS